MIPQSQFDYLLIETQLFSFLSVTSEIKNTKNSQLPKHICKKIQFHTLRTDAQNRAHDDIFIFLPFKCKNKSTISKFD